MWGKTASSTFSAIDASEENLPFPIKGFNVDNGNEFLNSHLVYYSKHNPDGSKRKTPIAVTRSRAYKKNDNAHVEQKQYTHVRELFGYDRFDHFELVELMNEIYKYHNLLQNYFVPQMKLISKERIKSRYRRKYDKPRTPYERLLEEETISNEIKENLKLFFSQLNPFEINSQIEHKLRRFFQLTEYLNKKRDQQSA